MMLKNSMLMDDVIEYVDFWCYVELLRVFVLIYE